MAALTACNKDDDDNQDVKADRTVLIYISGECSLWDFVQIDLDEIKTGSMSIGDNNLLAGLRRPRLHKGNTLASQSQEGAVRGLRLNQEHRG